MGAGDSRKPHLALTFILTTMEGGVMQSRSYRSIEPFDSSVEMLRDYFDRLTEPRSEAS